MLTYDGATYAKRSDVALIGLPSDVGATTQAGQKHGPRHVRYHSDEQGLAFLTHQFGGTIVDTGDVLVKQCDNTDYQRRVARRVAKVAKRTQFVVALGGDDSVSYGVARGLEKCYGPIGILHYDAHTDLYGSHKEPVDHSNWVMHLAAKGFPIHQRMCRAGGPHEPYADGLTGYPVLIVVDMDVFDPAYSPGVACPVPFGPTSHEVLSDIREQTVARDVVGLCITEVVPDRDINAQTALLANALIHRVLAQRFPV